MLSTIAPLQLSYASMPAVGHAMRASAPAMGLGFPSPKDLSEDPPIEEVLRIAKAEQQERLARLALIAAQGSFLPGGGDLMRKLPGTGPFGYFDPWKLTPEDCSEARRYREAEVIHGRVAMMAALGYVVQESFHPIFGSVGGPVIRQLDDLLKTSNGLLAGSTLLMIIGFSEIYRARTGWMDPKIQMSTLRPDYKPGDLGFDPLNLQPKDQGKFVEMQEKELNNGRLAMIGVSGMTAQELVSGTTLFA